MPIKRLQRATQGQFPQLGQLRKGAEKPDEKRPGKDLDHFRFTSDDPDALARFQEFYGDEPRWIKILLPFATMDENFEVWQESWNGKSLLHRCDGETCVRWLDDKTQSYRDDPVPCPDRDLDKSVRNRCKPVGRLKVVIPALKRLAYVMVLTTSEHDILTLQDNLLALQGTRGDLRGIPMILRRVEREISTPVSGKRVRTKKHLLQIEAEPTWVELQLEAQQRQALPGGTPLALPEPQQLIETIEHGSLDIATGEIVDVTPVAPAPIKPGIRAAMLKKIEAMWREVDKHAAEPVAEAYKAAVRAYDDEKLVAYGKDLRARLDKQQAHPPTAEPSDTELLIESYEEGASYEPTEADLVEAAL